MIGTLLSIKWPLKQNMKNSNIAFIGGGNMARSIIYGLVADKFPPTQIHVSDPKLSNSQEFKEVQHIQRFTDNISAIRDCDIIILAVKPQKMKDVAKQIAPNLQTDNLLISIAAGIRIIDLTYWLTKDTVAIVRAMPNMPASIQASATTSYANKYVSSDQHDMAESIFRSIGQSLWIDDEGKMDSITALSGSGPAYFFLVIEAMEKAAIELGIEPELAHLLCVQTAFGSAKIALESNKTAETLRKSVTSPGGTTESALHELNNSDLHGLFKNALISATLRSHELSIQLEQEDS